MEITSEGEFKVGNTKLSTPIMIRIPEYGHELPEIHSSSPISIPMYASVANIINWFERDIGVEFCNKTDMERVFFFVLEYNRFAQDANKKIDDIEQQYKLAPKAQANIYRILSFNNYNETKKAKEDIPFKAKPFRKPLQKNEIISSYRNPYIEKDKNKQKPVGREYFNPGDSFAYDIFAPVSDRVSPRETSFAEVELDV
jgi:hypothetical protein